MADTVPLSQASRGGFRGDPGWLGHTGWQDQNKCSEWQHLHDCLSDCSCLLPGKLPIKSTFKMFTNVF